MSRWLPYPLLALSLLAMWVLLTQSFSAAQLLLGTAVALIATWTMTRLQPERAALRSLRTILRLVGIVTFDVVRSNLAVSKIILLPKSDRVSNFVRLPLDLRDRYGLTVLALIITATPGTMWVQYDRGRGMLLVHVLDLLDEGEWIRLIKRRYESLLLEIFES